MRYNPFQRIKNRNFSIREDLRETFKDIKNYWRSYAFYSLGTLAITSGIIASSGLDLQKPGIHNMPYMLHSAVGYGGGLVCFIFGNMEKERAKLRIEKTVLDS